MILFFLFHSSLIIPPFHSVPFLPIYFFFIIHETFKSYNGRYVMGVPYNFQSHFRIHQRKDARRQGMKKIAIKFGLKLGIKKGSKC